MSTTEIVDEQQAYVLPSAQQTYSDPAVELTARNLLASYFGTPDQPGLIGQQIPIPIQQIAGLSPLEIQARNMAQGLGGFGGQLAEAEGLYRQAAQGFDPASAGVFGDPQARALYMQSLGQYDPRMAQQFLDQESRALMRGAARDTTGIDRDISREISQAQGGIRGAEAMIRQGAQSSADEAAAAQRMALEARGQAGREADIGQSAMRRAASNIGTGISQAKTESRYQEREGLSEAQRLAQQLGSIGSEAGAGARQGEAAIAKAASGIGGQVGTAQQRALEATRRAREQTGQAGSELTKAGSEARKYAQQGISALQGTGGQFDPSSIQRFMDPFTQQVIDAEQAEIERLGKKQSREAKAQAIRAGAFGGSRGAVQQAEIDRNVLEQQARTGAQLRSQGYQQAAQAAQQAFEQAQGRQQNLGQLTSSIGQSGAGTQIQAAQAKGNLGLSAEQMAQSGAFQGGQLGMTGQMNEAQLAERAANLGISTDQLRAQLAQQGQAATQAGRQMSQAGAFQRAQIGTQGQQAQANIANQAAQMGISTEQLRAQLGQQAFDTARQQGQLGMQAGQNIGALAGQRGQLGLSGAQARLGSAGQRADIGQGMGSQYGQAQQMGMGSYQDQMRRMQGAAGGLGGLTQDQFGTALQAYGAGTAAQRAGAAGIAGLGQQGYNMLTGQIGTMAGLGQTGRGIQDRAYGAQYTAATQMADEPYMRLQRGQQMLGGLSGYLPQYQSGYGTATRGVSGQQDPGTAGKIAGFLGFAGDAYKFGKDEGWWGGGG